MSSCDPAEVPDENFYSALYLIKIVIDVSMKHVE